MLQPFIQDGKIDRVALTAELRRFLDLALASARFEGSRGREPRLTFRIKPFSSRERRSIHPVLRGTPWGQPPREGVGEKRQAILPPSQKNWKSSPPQPTMAGEGSPLRDSLAPQ